MCFFTGDICASGTNGRHCLLLLVPWAFFLEKEKGALFHWSSLFPVFFLWGPVCRSMKIQVRFLSSTDLFVGKSKSNRWRTRRSRVSTLQSLTRSDLCVWRSRTKSILRRSTSLKRRRNNAESPRLSLWSRSHVHLLLWDLYSVGPDVASFCDGTVQMQNGTAGTMIQSPSTLKIAVYIYIQ